MKARIWLAIYIGLGLGVWAWTIAAVAWIPSALYSQAVVDALLIDGGSSGAKRIDQLTATSSVNPTDSFPNCQGCGSGTQAKSSTLTQIAAAVTSILTSTENSYTANQQIVPAALTNNSSIAVNLAPSSFGTIQLSATGQTVQCPTGVTSGQFATVTFLIQQPNAGGAFDLNWDTCYRFTAGTPPKQSNNGLSAADHAYDMVTCAVEGGSPVIAFCGQPQANLASSSSFALRGNHVASPLGASGGETTQSVTITNSVPGDLRTVEMAACTNSCAAGPAVAQATSVTDGTNACSPVAGAFYGGANGVTTDIWKCPKIVGAASSNVVVTWPASVSFAVVFVQEWVPSTVAPDAGLGLATQGTGANPSYSTSGPTTQAGELALSVVNDASALTANAGTQIDIVNGNFIAQYQTPASLATATNSATATAGRWSASMAAFQHY